MLEAGRAHRDLGIDTSQRIDPFDALERSGVLVFRRRLDRIAGLYIPGRLTESGIDGVLINSGHPLSKQRYTAAHELAHHRRDRQFLIDTDTEWLGRVDSGRSDRERFAEAFAAWFLMPRKLIEETGNRLGLDFSRLDGPDTYALALELGTSYEATVRHLRDMRRIDSPQRVSLLEIQPRRIKQELGSGLATNLRKDVWLVQPSRNVERVFPSQGDTLIFALPETPSSGYIWRPSSIPTWLEPIGDEYLAPSGGLIGGRGERRLLYRVDGPGRQQVELLMGRPWQPDIVADTFQVEVISQPQPETGPAAPELLAAAGGH
jgi:Zn-dependent peptidase ImmA (M78 family)